MIDFESKPRYDIDDLKIIMRLLRSPQGCPWDCEQTHKSIRRNLLEEAYELADAIDNDNAADMLEELGDVLLQVIFHADIAEDQRQFTFDDVIDVTCKKLLRRHPHVFNISGEQLFQATAENGEESINVWEAAKRAEKQHETTSDSMKSVVRAIPALWRAEKIQKKAAGTGYDWPDYTGAMEALKSELAELTDAVEQQSGSREQQEAVKEEIGDILFSAVNVARFYGIDPEDALNTSSDKFIKRFKQMEESAARRGIKFNELQLNEMEALYQIIKDNNR